MTSQPRVRPRAARPAPHRLQKPPLCRYLPTSALEALAIGHQQRRARPPRTCRSGRRRSGLVRIYVEGDGRRPAARFRPRRGRGNRRRAAQPPPRPPARWARAGAEARLIRVYGQAGPPRPGSWPCTLHRFSRRWAGGSWSGRPATCWTGAGSVPRFFRRRAGHGAGWPPRSSRTGGRRSCPLTVGTTVLFELVGRRSRGWR